MRALLQSDALASLPGFAHAFERLDTRLSDALPSPPARLHQVHGNQVHVIDADTDLRPYRETTIEARPAGDALVTSVAGLTVAVATADCAPILVADPRRGIAAAIHAGWRGVAADVVAATLLQMRERFGCDAGDCLAAIGPCVSAAHYEVSADVRDAFLEQRLDAGLFRPTRPGHWRCDLAGAVRQQLQRARVGTIDVLGRCTVAEPGSFHSWRRDGAAAGRMLSGICVRTAT